MSLIDMRNTKNPNLTQTNTMATTMDIVRDWLKRHQINIWDEKYDYVTHNDHWITSIWSDDCEKCRTSGKPKPTTTTTTTTPLSTGIGSASGNHVIKSTVSSSLLSASTPPYQPAPATNGLLPPAGHNTTTPNAPQQSSGAKSSENVANSTPMTPIQSTNISTRAFITPYSSNKFNDTYTRSTRRSARKHVLNKTTSDQDLINLNETFDMYKSALASTPGVAKKPETINEDFEKQGPLLDLATPKRPLDSTITRSASKAAAAAISSTPVQSCTTSTNSTSAVGLGHFLPPPRPKNNFELLQGVNQTNGSSNILNSNNTNTLSDNHEEHEHAQPVTSKIPRIPVRASRVHDF